MEMQSKFLEELDTKMVCIESESEESRAKPSKKLNLKSKSNDQEP